LKILNVDVVHNEILHFRLKDLWSIEINKTIQGYAELVRKGSQKHEVLHSFAEDMSDFVQTG